MVLVRLIPALLGILLFVAVANGWLGDLDGGRSRLRGARSAPVLPNLSEWSARPVVVPLPLGEKFVVPRSDYLEIEAVSVRGQRPGHEGVGVDSKRPVARLVLLHPKGGGSERVLGRMDRLGESERYAAEFSTKIALPPGSEIWLAVRGLVEGEARLVGRLLREPAAKR